MADFKQLNSRLIQKTLVSDGYSYSKIQDTKPPLLLLPYSLTESGTHIGNIFISQRLDRFDNINKSSVLAIDASNFESNSKAAKVFVSNTFAIPYSKIDTNRIKCCGEVHIDIASFDSIMELYAVNVSGLVYNNESSYEIFDDSPEFKISNNPDEDKYKTKIVKVSYGSILRGDYSDLLILGCTFKLAGEVTTISQIVTV